LPCSRPGTSLRTSCSRRPLGFVAALLISSAGFEIWHAPALGRRCVVHVITGLGFSGAFLVGGLGAAVLAHGTYNVLVDWGVQAGRSRW
jgi:hypothetical protein